MIGRLGEENIQWSFPGDFLTEEKVGAIRRQEGGEPRDTSSKAAAAAAGTGMKSSATELFFHGRYGESAYFGDEMPYIKF